MPGWDVPDYREGIFPKWEFIFVMIRNGSVQNTSYPKPSAKKLPMFYEGQYSPIHFHWYKMEDIVNYGAELFSFRYIILQPKMPLPIQR